MKFITMFSKSRIATLFTMAGLLSLPASANTQFNFDEPGNLVQTQTASATAPSILTQPKSVVVSPNATGTFSVVATGSPEVNYEWRFKGVTIPGASSDTLAVTEASVADEGEYTVLVSNTSGSTAFASAYLYIDSDGDGLGDSYEIATFGDLTISNGVSDRDQDGVSDVDEWQEGSDPNDPADFRPRLTLQTANGMILPEPVADSYTLGDTVTLEAQPFDGRGFYGWYGNANRGPDPVNEIVMDGHKTVSANFNYHGVIAWGLNDTGEISIPDSLRNVVQVDAGYSHVLVLHADGSISGWGSTSSNRLAIPLLTDAISVSAGDRHNLALRAEGSLVAWGTTSNGLNTVPAALAEVDAVAIDAGEDHNLVLLRDGTVRAWGETIFGQSTIPVGLNTVIKVSAGDEHSLALRADGTIWAWGDNSINQLNVPAHSGRVVDILAGEDHSLALLEDGTVIAWGRADDGSLLVPEGLTDVVNLGVGRGYSMAQLSDGTVVAWGENQYGESGFATALPRVENVDGGIEFGVALGELEVSTDLPVFTGLPSIMGATDTPLHHRLSARNFPTSYGATGLPVGLQIEAATGLITGTPLASGTFPITVSATNDAGTVERQMEIIINPPIPLVTSPTFADAWIGEAFEYQVTGVHSPTTFGASGLPAGLSIDGATGLVSGFPEESGIFSVEVSTFNQYGSDTITVDLEIRDGSAWGWNEYGQSDVPPDLSNLVSIVGGYYHSLTIREDGTVAAWGYNAYGQTDIPANLNEVVMVDGGNRHSLALKSDGTVVGWGSGSNGQITIPSGVTDFVSIAAGGYFSLGLRADGTVMAWGSNSYGESEVPDLLNGVVAITAGEYFSLALKSDGTVMGWGDNRNGQTVIPEGLSDVIAIDAGRYHALALKRDGTVVAWGSNGDNKATVPDGLTDVVAISAGDDHSMALRANGEIITWGGNTYGQITVPDFAQPAALISAGGWHSLSLPSVNPRQERPQILNRGFVVGGIGKTFDHQIATRNEATGFAATGLPNGLTIDADGRITGAPTQVGSFPVTITASNSSGGGQMDLTFVIHRAPPLIAEPPSLTAYAGLGFRYQTEAVNNPSYASDELPEGLAIDSSGLISGTVADSASGSYPTTITATNLDGEAITSFIVDVEQPLLIGNMVSAIENLAEGERDIWRFDGQAGDTVKVRASSGTWSLDLHLEILGPDGAVLVSSSNANYDTSLNLELPVDGAYTIAVRGWRTDRSGSYNLTYQNINAPYTVGPDDEGGLLENGVAYAGNLPSGDIDMWEFSAAEGDPIRVRVAAQQNAGHDLRLRIYDPSGNLVAFNDRAYWDVSLGFSAPEAGSYRAVVESFYWEETSNEPYSIQVANSGQAFSVADGDDGGALANGAAGDGALPRGDIDMWEFDAESGDDITVRVASVQNFSDDLQLRIIGPSGQLISLEDRNFWDAHANFIAPESGRYVAVVEMYYFERSSTGYRINLANAGQPFNDEELALAESIEIASEIVRGDIDAWLIAGNRGDRLTFQASSNGFRLWLDLLSSSQLVLGRLSNTYSGNLEVVLNDDGPHFLRLQSWYLENSGSYALSYTKERAPILNPIGDIEVSIGESVAFSASATPGDAPEVTFELVGAPSHAVINASTGEFFWIGSEQAGEFTFEIRAFGGDLSDWETVTIKVVDPGAGQSFEQWIAEYSDSGIPSTLTGLMDDPDGDGLTNGFEYLSGNHPYGPNERKVIEVIKNGANESPIVRLHLRSDDATMNPFVQVSDDLNNWTDFSISVNEAGQWVSGDFSELEVMNAIEASETVWQVDLKYKGIKDPVMLRLRLQVEN